MRKAAKNQNLPPDNMSRLAIYDALCEHARLTGTPEIANDEVFERVIGRLRVLVPRELHLAGDRAYFDEKVDACVDAGIIAVSSNDGRRLLTLTGQPPLVRYPDGEVRNYLAGLEPARERLDRDNARLRERSFDVLKFVPSIADDPNGCPFQELLASMREHGFMKQFPVVKHEDGVIVDGRARQQAAERLQLNVEYKYWSKQAAAAARRRDTPLNRVLVAIHSNAARIDDDVIDTVHKRVAAVTDRAWEDTAADLALTQEWRRLKASGYSPKFEIKKHVYRKGDEATVQVTSDDKVMVRSLIEAGGLTNYKMMYLRDYVPFEEARSAHSAGPKAMFARVEDLISGIATMQEERRAANLKVDPQWAEIRDWLVRTFQPGGDRGE